MGQFSVLAKKDGYIVAMAPAESYLDPTTSQFDRSLSHPYPEWKDLQPNFRYHGHNTYAYLLAEYGTTLISSKEKDDDRSNSIEDDKGVPIRSDPPQPTTTTEISSSPPLSPLPLSPDDSSSSSSSSSSSGSSSSGAKGILVDTFDFVTIQLYEGVQQPVFSLIRSYTHTFIDYEQPINCAFSIHVLWLTNYCHHITYCCCLYFLLLLTYGYGCCTVTRIFPHAISHLHSKHTRLSRVSRLDRVSV